MITINPLPADYQHPQNWNVAGHFGLYEDGRLIATAPTRAELEALLPVAPLQAAA